MAKISVKENWMLYLDDIREPKDGKPWIIARNIEHAKNLVKHKGMPTLISFDHDLDINETGFDFAKWLVEQDQDGKITFPKNFSYIIHSANPVGAANIKGLIDSYLNFKNNQQ